MRTLKVCSVSAAFKYTVQYYLFVCLFACFGHTLGMCDLSSPTRDQTCAPCCESAVLTTRLPGKSPVIVNYSRHAVRYIPVIYVFYNLFHPPSLFLSFSSLVVVSRYGIFYLEFIEFLGCLNSCWGLVFFFFLVKFSKFFTIVSSNNLFAPFFPSPFLLGFSFAYVRMFVSHGSLSLCSFFCHSFF